MATLLRIVACVFCGVTLGLMFTSHTLDEANRSFAAGPWRGAAREHAGTLDPYALAANARAGLLALGAAEGLSFVADSDSKGAKLTTRCDYEVTGTIPAARFWSLSLLTPDGYPVQTAAARYAFTSANVLRFDNEPLRIEISSEARAGNWLPSGTIGAFVLMLRLYDTGLSTVGATLDATVMPQIRKLRCR
jgi:hypothetical protein